jgi:hypothetical protein
MARSKYHAVPTVIDGIRFASKAEAKRYQELKLAQSVGAISDLELQPRYRLHVNGWKLGEYRGDFRYRNSEGQTVVEDVKGMLTPMYRWKKKHVAAEYGVDVVEVR